MNVFAKEEDLTIGLEDETTTTLNTYEDEDNAVLNIVQILDDNSTNNSPDVENRNVYNYED